MMCIYQSIDNSEMRTSMWSCIVSSSNQECISMFRKMWYIGILSALSITRFTLGNNIRI